MRDRDQQLIWEAFDPIQKRGIFTEDLYEIEYEYSAGNSGEYAGREWDNHHEVIDGVDRRYFTKDQIKRLVHMPDIPSGHDSREIRRIEKGDIAWRDVTVGGDTIILFFKRPRMDKRKHTDQMYLDEYIEWGDVAMAAGTLSTP